MENIEWKKKRQETPFVTFTVCQITDGSLQFCYRIERIFIFFHWMAGYDHRKSRGIGNQTQSSLLTFFIHRFSYTDYSPFDSTIVLCNSVFETRSIRVIVESDINDIINSNVQHERDISTFPSCVRWENYELCQVGTVLMINTNKNFWNVFFPSLIEFFFLFVSFSNYTIKLFRWNFSCQILNFIFYNNKMISWSLIDHKMHLDISN